MPRSLGFSRYAPYFDGSDDIVKVTNLAISNSITFCIQVSPFFAYDDGSHHGFLAWFIDTDNWIRLHKRSTNELEWYYMSGGTAYNSLKVIDYDVETWHYLAGTTDYTNEEMALVFDGEIVATDSIPQAAFLSDTADVIVGAATPDLWAPAEMHGNNPLIYSDKVLSLEEIRWNMLNYHNPVTDGLALWLPMEEGQGTTVKDYSGMGNDGTLLNGPLWQRVSQWQMRGEVGL